MPKVSEEHLERRRQQILSAALQCFARKGFHSTSMQDIFAESGMSAGAVYRYFKSKNEIILAIADVSLERVWPSLEAMLEEDPVPPIDEAVTRYARLVLESNREITCIIPQAWAAATHDPNIAESTRLITTRLRGWWIELVRREKEAGRLHPDTDVEAVGKVLFGISPGLILQDVLMGDLDIESVQRGIRDLLRLFTTGQDTAA